MGNSCLSLSSMSQFFSLIFSHRLDYFSFVLKIMFMISHLFIAISVVLLMPLFTRTLSERGSSCTFLLLALIYDIFTPTLLSSEHASAFVLPEEEEEELKLSFKSSRDEFVGSNGINVGKYDCTREKEEWKSTLAWKVLEEGHYNMVDAGGGGGEGEGEDMDSLWEAFEAERIDVVVKNKKSGDDEGDKYYGTTNDQDEEEEEMRNIGCLQGFKCCSTGPRGKMMNTTTTRPGNNRNSSIVKISKPLKIISWWRLFTKKNTSF